MVSHTANKMPAREDDDTESTETASAETAGDDSGRGNMGDTASPDLQGDGGGSEGCPQPQSQTLALGYSSGAAAVGAGGGGAGGGGGKALIHPQRHNLKNRFDLIRTLGEGTYGKVKLACERSTGEQVAIKYVKKTKIRDETDLSRIRREISILSTLRHPNIVNIRQVFEKKDRIVLVMDCALGGELYDYLNTKRCLPETETRRIFRQIAGAVNYIHQNGIVHRDLKLENIILDIDGSIKIADFGLANYYSLDKTLRTFCGSPLYASPEIVNGKAYHGPEVDVWSLGVVLYTLSYGAMPFESSNLKVLRQQISTGQYPEPAHPCAAASLIRNMLTVNPARRATLPDILNHWWVNLGHDLCPDGSQYRPAVDSDTLSNNSTSSVQAGSLFSTLTSSSDLQMKAPPPGLHRVPGARSGGKAKVVETSFDEDEMLYDIGTSSSSPQSTSTTGTSSTKSSPSSGPSVGRAAVDGEQSSCSVASSLKMGVGGVAEQWRQTIASGIEEIRSRVVQSLAGHQDQNQSPGDSRRHGGGQSMNDSEREENKVTVTMVPSLSARVCISKDDSVNEDSLQDSTRSGGRSPSDLLTMGDSTEDDSCVFDPQPSNKIGDEGNGSGNVRNQSDRIGDSGDSGEADKTAITMAQKPRRGILKRKGKFSGGDSGCCIIMTDDTGPNNKSLDEEDGKSPLPPSHPPPPVDSSLDSSTLLLSSLPTSSESPVSFPGSSVMDNSASQPHHSANSPPQNPAGTSRIVVEPPLPPQSHPPLSSSAPTSSSLPPCPLHRPIMPNYYSYTGSSASSNSPTDHPADSSSNQFPGVEGQVITGGPWVHPQHSLSVATGSSYGNSESAFVIPNAVCTCPMETDVNKVVRRRKGILKNSSSARSSLLDDARKRLSMGSLSSNSSADILDLSYDSSDGSDSNASKTSSSAAGTNSVSSTANTSAAAVSHSTNGVSLQPGDRNSFSLEGEFTDVPLDGIPSLGHGASVSGDDVENDASSGDPASSSRQQAVFHDNVFDFSEAKQVLQKALNFVN